MAVRGQPSEGHGGAPTVYLLFAGRHAEPARGVGSLVAIFACPDEARAAFRQTRLRLSDEDGWAELTVVAGGGRAERLSWFGSERRRADRPPSWLLAPDVATNGAGDRRPPIRIPWPGRRR